MLLTVRPKTAPFRAGTSCSQVNSSSMGPSFFFLHFSTAWAQCKLPVVAFHMHVSSALRRSIADDEWGGVKGWPNYVEGCIELVTATLKSNEFKCRQHEMHANPVALLGCVVARMSTKCKRHDIGVELCMTWPRCLQHLHLLFGRFVWFCMHEAPHIWHTNSSSFVPPRVIILHHHCGEKYFHLTTVDGKFE